MIENLHGLDVLHGGKHLSSYGVEQDKIQPEAVTVSASVVGGLAVML